MSDATVDQSPPPFQKVFVAVGLIWLAMFVIAETGYPNLSDNERRIGAYVLDAVHNGHWFVQRDAMNQVASKPPLLTWVASIVTLAIGKLTQFAIHLPSALATLGVAWLLLTAGWKRFGWLAATLAALTYLLSPMSDKQVFTSRYDGLFSLPVTWAALAAFSAWTENRSWTPFWLACAVGTLVKGPLGLVLGALGLLAAVWEWRSGAPLRPRGNHLPGILLYLAICGGWFGLAYLQMGPPLIQKMIGRELVGHSLSSEEGGIGGAFWEPIYSVLAYYSPWSIAGVIALWRVFRKPAADLDTRRFERFLFCWFLVGLVLFSISPHQRGRLIFPLLPAFALLTGRELARWLANVSSRTILRVATATTILVLAGATLYHHLLLRDAQQIKDTLALRKMANDLRTQVGDQFPVTYLDAPFTIPFYLNTYRPWVSAEAAAGLLRGDAAAFVIVRDTDKLQAALPTNSTVGQFHTLMSQPVKNGRTVVMLSNHPRLEWTPHMAAIISPFYVRMDNVKLIQARGEEFIFEQPGSLSSVTFSNISDAPQHVHVRFADDVSHDKEHTLGPGETWKP